MKKMFVVLLLALLCSSAVFAAGNAITASVVPYGFQISTSSADGQEPVKSTYGIGAEVLYSRFLTDRVFVKAGISQDTFLLPEGREAFTHVLASAGAGYVFTLSGPWSLDVGAGIGTDTLIYMGKVSETVTVLTGLGVNYALKDNLSLRLGCEGSFGFAKKDSTNYVNYRILPKLGVSFGF